MIASWQRRSCRHYGVLNFLVLSVDSQLIATAGDQLFTAADDQLIAVVSDQLIAAANYQLNTAENFTWCRQLCVVLSANHQLVVGEHLTLRWQPCVLQFCQLIIGEYLRWRRLPCVGWCRWPPWVLARCRWPPGRSSRCWRDTSCTVITYTYFKEGGGHWFKSYIRPKFCTGIKMPWEKNGFSQQQEEN